MNYKTSRITFNKIKMSELSGYDGDAVGFDSITLVKRDEAISSTQTENVDDIGVGSQTNFTHEVGTLATLDELKPQEETPAYPPPGLNEFLRKVVPGMLAQLDQNDNELLQNSSDSDEEEMLTAKLFQEINLTDLPGMGGGDESRSVLDLCWSDGGNSLAVSIGRNQHENWCNDDGLIRIFTVKRSAGNTYVRSLDVTQKSCISTVKYHPFIAALLAYGTTSGEVVLCNLRSLDAAQLSSPAGSHGSKRVTALQWADATLANSFLTMQILNTGKRRNASDHVLISSGSDGTIIVSQVNVNLRIFENIITYFVNGSRKMAAVDISCFDFIKTFPLRPIDDHKLPSDVFVVGSSTGNLYLCKTNSYQQIVDSKMVDPVYEVLDGHRTCVLNVAFSSQKPGIFISASIDSELRMYDINQTSPIKVICLDSPISCMAWVPNNPCVIVLGLARASGQVLKVFNVNSGRDLPIDGLTVPGGCVTAISVIQGEVCRIVTGDSDSNVRIWELPTRRIRVSDDELDEF